MVPKSVIQFYGNFFSKATKCHNLTLYAHLLKHFITNRDLNFDKKHASLIFAHISHQGKQKQIHGKIPKSYQSIMKGFSTNRDI